MKKMLICALFIGSLQAMEPADTAFMQQLTKTALKDIEKEDQPGWYAACRFAYKGEMKEARDAFMKAAAERCPRSLLFLSQDYKSGEFLGARHGGIGDLYAKELGKQFGNMSDKQRQVEWWLLNDDVVRFIKQLRTINRARGNESFRNALRLLSYTDPVFFEPPLASVHKVEQKIADLLKAIVQEVQNKQTKTS